MVQYHQGMACDNKGSILKKKLNDFAKEDFKTRIYYEEDPGVQLDLGTVELRIGNLKDTGKIPEMERTDKNDSNTTRNLADIEIKLKCLCTLIYFQICFTRVFL